MSWRGVRRAWCGAHRSRCTRDVQHTRGVRLGRMGDTKVGRVSNVEMVTPMALIGKVFFPSLSTFEPPLAHPAKGIIEVWYRPGFDIDRGRLARVGVQIMALAALNLLR